jgi:hypothetical protein
MRNLHDKESIKTGMHVCPTISLATPRSEYSLIFIVQNETATKFSVTSSLSIMRSELHDMQPDMTIQKVLAFKYFIKKGSTKNCRAALNPLIAA